MVFKLPSLKDLSNMFMQVPPPPYQYDFLAALSEKEYPKYLKAIYKHATGKVLNLKNPKKFSEKIQWLKLHDSTPIKSQLTDKVLVRDWVKDRIGEEYLKPLLQVAKTYDDIDFEKLPEKFIMKANHGCKWHYKIKNKENFLNTEALQKIVKRQFDGWMEQCFGFFGGFEMQYKNIDPQIIIEELLVFEKDEFPIEIEVYCFNGEPKITQKIKYSEVREASVFDENLELMDFKFGENYVALNEVADEQIKKAVELSKILAKEFKLVRVDWLLKDNKIYFNEMTFTPFSGFYLLDDEWDLKFGSFLNLKK